MLVLLPVVHASVQGRGFQKTINATESEYTSVFNHSAPRNVLSHRGESSPLNAQSQACRGRVEFSAMLEGSWRPWRGPGEFRLVLRPKRLFSRDSEVAVRSRDGPWAGLVMLTAVVDPPGVSRESCRGFEEEEEKGGKKRRPPEICATEECLRRTGEIFKLPTSVPR